MKRQTAQESAERSAQDTLCLTRTAAALGAMCREMAAVLKGQKRPALADWRISSRKASGAEAVRLAVILTCAGLATEALIPRGKRVHLGEALSEGSLARTRQFVYV